MSRHELVTFAGMMRAHIRTARELYERPAPLAEPRAARRELLAVLQRVSASEVAARCRVSVATVSKWASGKTVPSAEHQRALREHLRVSGEWGQGAKARELTALRSRAGLSNRGR